MTLRKREVGAVAIAIAVFFASLLTQIPVASASGPNLPRIAIKKVAVNTNINASRIDTELMLTELEKALQGTKKFSVLTRQSALMQDVREEQQFSKSSLSDGKGAAEGKLKVAQLLLIPTVQRYSLYRNVTPIPNIDNKFRRSDHGLLELSVQVVDTATAEVKGTFSLKDSISTKQQMTNSKSKTPSSSLYTAMVKNVAVELSRKLTAKLFPMMVMKENAGMIWINAGADSGISKGQKLVIYMPGDDLVDPYTGEKLGSAEMEIGKASVVQVTPKFCVAKMQGDAMASKGFIVRTN